MVGAKRPSRGAMFPLHHGPKWILRLVVVYREYEFAATFV
jgi:hypothetical protein